MLNAGGPLQLSNVLAVGDEPSEDGDERVLLHKYMAENEALRIENATMHHMREMLVRDHELVCRENERLVKKLDALENHFLSEEPSTDWARTGEKGSTLTPARQCGRRTSDLLAEPSHESSRSGMARNGVVGSFTSELNAATPACCRREGTGKCQTADKTSGEPEPECSGVFEAPCPSVPVVSATAAEVTHPEAEAERPGTPVAFKDAVPPMDTDSGPGSKAFTWEHNAPRRQQRLKPRTFLRTRGRRRRTYPWSQSQRTQALWLRGCLCFVRTKIKARQGGPQR
ncbi:hypothetical protein HPB49_011554 [Dermacentor silvarum]|uniref:Uncharacterized protein n=1 Tax=Dermacentor silvarum TaxID=543639 RepID=A0ACB8D4Z6_DERSI|nr:hypothetical protein HPB49_011554 [Dermacentor silvarum]